MTDKPIQHSVTLVNHLRGIANVGIDKVEQDIEEWSAKVEAAFMAEIAHLDDLYSDKLTEDDDALESVLRFDKGYAKTMASIQAATERLVEARAHIARVTNTIEYHPAFTGNGATPGKTYETVYKLGPITYDKHYPVSWTAIQELLNGNWPFSDHVHDANRGKSIIISCLWQCLSSKIDARAIANLSVEDTGTWAVEITELTADVDGKIIDYQPVEMEIDGRAVLSIAPYDCFAQASTIKETNHE